MICSQIPNNLTTTGKLEGADQAILLAWSMKIILGRTIHNDDKV
jgi:hypothetical protein